ncbi:putative SPOUT methyltransferase [Corchorus olitorius]|uniref:SPOUT methyltransferase n=1 Tax=Corchorus olitorius TaxID=93759 RepID=A0A1R3J8K4_9ROSI|nr:putative SPOUT methyltransferase [Corchorus olitorius]
MAMAICSGGANLLQWKNSASHSSGKTRSPGVQLLVDEYIAKLKNYCLVDDVQIRSNPKNARDPRAQVDDEDTAIVNLIKSDDWVVLLDERGVDIRSEQMADLLGDAGNTGASRLSFCIGGPYGHGQQIRERANISIKLSSMIEVSREPTFVCVLQTDITISERYRQSLKLVEAVVM